MPSVAPQRPLVGWEVSSLRCASAGIGLQGVCGAWGVFAKRSSAPMTLSLSSILSENGTSQRTSGSVEKKIIKSEPEDST